MVDDDDGDDDDDDGDRNGGHWEVFFSFTITISKFSNFSPQVFTQCWGE